MIKISLDQKMQMDIEKLCLDDMKGYQTSILNVLEKPDTYKFLKDI